MSTRRDISATLLGLPLIANSGETAPGRYSEAAVRIISYTLYAEARGEPFKGKMAVAAVIQTRSRLSNLSLAETCLQEKQFSCWNNLKAVPGFYISGEGMKPADLRARSDSYGIAWVLLSSSRKWEYLTHFYNPSIVKPAWADSLRGRRTIGNHVFGYID
jgi:spore germination cell wall hydrolase CwlJ-like protein